MKWIRLLSLLTVACFAGCGPQVSGPGSEPASEVDAGTVDEALEAEANAASEGETY
jgi:hypothetical protein